MRCAWVSGGSPNDACREVGRAKNCPVMTELSRGADRRLETVSGGAIAVQGARQGEEKQPRSAGGGAME